MIAAALLKRRSLTGAEILVYSSGEVIKIMFGIWAEVAGGVTGRRSAWLKANGELLRFATREQAVAEATRLVRERNGNPNQTASFRYVVRPLPNALNQ